MEPEQVAGIVKSLTKAQAQMLRDATPYGDWWLIRWRGERPNGWRDKGLSLYWNPEHDSLTTLGLAVRSALKENDRGE